MSAALGLYRLQQVDSQMDQIHARLKSIREILENDREMKIAMEAVTSSESALSKANSILKQSDADVENLRMKIEQTEATLYGGMVKNPKELQDLQMEAASLKKHLATLEERELEDMGRTEQAENNVSKAMQDLAKIEADKKEQNRDLTGEYESLGRDLERLESERQAVVSDVEDGALKTYSTLRAQKRGVAVALVSDNACGACGATLTASQFQTSRSNAQLFTCPTCGRILYSG